MLQSAPPSGPRSSRQSGRLASSRLPSRGGIQKRNSTPTRVDKDGDLVMGSASTNRDNGHASGSGRGGGGRGSAQARKHGTSDGLSSRGSIRPTRTGIDTSTIQKAVLRGMDSNTKLSRGSRAGARSLRGRGQDRDGGNGLDKISVLGLKESKAASNEDGGIKDLIIFLERKATERQPEKRAIKIRKSYLDGEALIIFLRPEDTPHIQKLNGFQFASASLKIEVLHGNGSRKTSPNAKNDDSETANTIDTLKSVLSRRYNAEAKLLDLSKLGSDSELLSLGMFNSTSTESKFFPALMKVCDSTFKTAHQKEEAIISVTLADNALADIRSVTSLSQTFPALKNLDLSNNQIKSLRDLDGWRWKFRKLEHLVLSGNPLEINVTHYKNDVMKWYPTLRLLNNEQVRTEQDVLAAAGSKLPLPTRGPNFRDEADIAATFLTQFFLAYDSDRFALVNGYYDAQSTFSLSVNTSAPKDKNHKPTGWDQYIKQSRNLARLSNPTARMSRLHNGEESIRDTFAILPATRHPDLLGEPQKWCIECRSLSNIPDPTGQSPTGVEGLIVIAHGEFFEIDVSTAQPTGQRSFDRTFILGPGGGIGGIRIVSDMLVLRAYGGHNAWKPDEVGTVGDPQLLQSQTPQQHQIFIPEGVGAPGPGKTEEQVQKEVLAVQMSQGTGMTLEYSGMCLEQSGWNLESAAVAFEQAKASLPPEAFLQTG